LQNREKHLPKYLQQSRDVFQKHAIPLEKNKMK